VLIDHVNRFAYAAAIAPALRPRAVLLVHDFSPTHGPGPLPLADWHAGLRTAAGFERAYADAGATWFSTLAAFLRPGDFG
jgi:hypothetical protein